MTSQYQYQLDDEYRNRRMAQADNDRLVHETQTEHQLANPFGAVLNTMQRIVSRSPKAASSAPMTDTQTLSTVS